MAEFFSVFLAVFLAEIGDKTQLASALFAAEGGRSAWTVFFAASAALVSSTAIAVGAGAFLRSRLESWPLDYIAGAAFIAIGAWMIGKKLLAG